MEVLMQDDHFTFPRMCGGDPGKILCFTGAYGFSPHVRG